MTSRGVLWIAVMRMTGVPDPSRGRVGQGAADHPYYDPARHLWVAAVGDVQVDPGDELGARARPEPDVRADPQLAGRALQRERVVVLVPLAGRLGDVGLVLRDAVLGGRLAQRPAHVAGDVAPREVVQR